MIPSFLTCTLPIPSMSKCTTVHCILIVVWSSSPQIFVEEHLVTQTAVFWTEAKVWNDSHFLVAQLRIHMFCTTPNGCVKGLGIVSLR